MVRKLTGNPTKKSDSKNQNNIYHVIMEIEPAIIVGKQQTIKMPHAVFVFEDILHSTTKNPKGIRIYAKLPASDIDSAISQARGIANVLLAQFSFLTKTSIPELLIMKAYDATPGKKSGKFIQYYYDLPFAAESARTLDKSSLKKSSETILGLGEVDNNRVTRAMHWFRLATKSTDLLERFTCLWIGLETINLTLCNHYGIEVEYSTCDTCKKNVPTLTGVKRLFKDIEDDNLNWRKISKLRATTMHGSKPLHEIVSHLRGIIPSLENALYTGLNLIIGLEGSKDRIMNIGNPLQAHYISTATIEGSDLQLIDKVSIPTFKHNTGVIYPRTGGRYYRFEQKGVIDKNFKFKKEEHTLFARPHLSSKITAPLEEDYEGFTEF